MLKYIKMKFAPKKAANESTPLLISVDRLMEKKELLSDMINYVDGMTSMLLKFAGLNYRLDSDESQKTQDIISRSLGAAHAFDSKELDDSINKMMEAFSAVRFKPDFGKRV